MIKLNNLKKIIDIDRGLKRKWVAEQIEISESFFKQVMCGNHDLTLKKAIALAKLLKVDLYEIWSEK
jgi:plasmid maintenance system antidote protein VapI